MIYGETDQLTVMDLLMKAAVTAESQSALRVLMTHKVLNSANRCPFVGKLESYGGGVTEATLLSNVS